MSITPTENSRSYPIPSYAFLVVQAFLFIFTTVFYFTLQRGTSIPFLEYSGLLCLFRTSLFLFVALWLYAALLAVWDRHGGNKAFYYFEIGIWIIFIIIVLWIDRFPLWYGLNSSGDHLMQYTLASLTEENLTQFHRLTGWCSAFGMGFPLNELYPPGGHIIVFLFRVISLGLLTLKWAYTFSVLFSYLLFAFILYHIVRKWFGPLASILMLPLLLLDSADAMYFTWAQFFNIGLWGSGLGFALSIHALSECADASFPRSRRNMVTMLAALAFSFLLHPIFIVINGLWIILLLIISFLKHCTSPRQSLIESYSNHYRWLFYAILGLGLAAFWWLSFIASRSWIFEYGFWGRYMPDVGRGFLDGTLFPKSSAVLSVLGYIALFFGLFAKRKFINVLSLLGLITIFGGMESARHFFDFNAAHEFFEHMQVDRLAAVGKTISLLLIAGFIGAGIQYAWHATELNKRIFAVKHLIFPEPGSSHKNGFHLIASTFSTLFFAIILLLLAVPIFIQVQAVFKSTFLWQISPAARFVKAPPHTPAHWSGYLDVLDYLNAQEKMDDNQIFLHNTLPPARALTTESWGMIAAPAFSSIGIFVPRYMPAIILGTRPIFLNEWTLNLANVKYIFKQKTLPPNELDALQNIEKIHENEHLILYQRNDWSPQAWNLYGPGEVKLLENRDHLLRFKISNTASNSYLRLGISLFRKWEIRLNNRPVRQPLPSLNGEPEEAWKMIGIPLRDGVLEVRYQQQSIDHIATYISLASLILIICILISWNTSIPSTFNQFMANALSIIIPPILLLFQIAVSLFIIGLLAYSFFIRTPTLQKGVRYLGIYADQVGKVNIEPDGEKDLCFQLDFLRIPHHGKIQALNLIHIDEKRDSETLHRWTTKSGQIWRAAVMDSTGNRCDTIDGDLNLPHTKAQRLLVYATNPFTGPTPTPFLVRCEIEYDDGTIITIPPLE